MDSNLYGEKGLGLVQASMSGFDGIAFVIN